MLTIKSTSSGSTNIVLLPTLLLLISTLLSSVSCSPINALDCPPFTIKNGGGCSACPGGRIPDSSQSNCLDCVAGQFAAIGSSGCSICRAGTWSSDAATTCTFCSAGTYSIIEGSNSNTCEPCLPGEGSIAGSTSCTACKFPQYSSSNMACTTCEPGNSWTDPTKCNKCSSESYSTDGATCKTCTIAGQGPTKNQGSCHCLNGFYFNVLKCDYCDNGSSSADGMTCKVCLSGQVSILTQPCSDCPAGQKTLNGKLCGIVKTTQVQMDPSEYPARRHWRFNIEISTVDTLLDIWNRIRDKSGKTDLDLRKMWIRLVDGGYIMMERYQDNQLTILGDAKVADIGMTYYAL